MDEGIIKIIGLGSIAYGVLWCFFGYRFFKTLMTICGFVIGAIIGYLIGALANDQTVAIVLGLIGGVGCAFLVHAVYNISVFLIGAFLGGVAYQILGLLAAQQLHPILGVILLIAGGILALKIVKLAIVLGTAFSGSSNIVVGVILLLGSQYDVQHLLAFKAEHSQLILMLFGILILGIAGFLYQYKIAFGVPFSFDSKAHKIKSTPPEEKQSKPVYNEYRAHTPVNEEKEKTKSDDVKDYIFCKNCGKRIGSDSKFCNFCGVEHSIITIPAKDINIPQEMRDDTQKTKIESEILEEEKESSGSEKTSKQNTEEINSGDYPSIEEGKEEPETTDEWNCPKCYKVNPNTIYTCNYCGYKLI